MIEESVEEELTVLRLRSLPMGGGLPIAGVEKAARGGSHWVPAMASGRGWEHLAPRRSGYLEPGWTQSQSRYQRRTARTDVLIASSFRERTRVGFDGPCDAVPPVARGISDCPAGCLALERPMLSDASLLHDARSVAPVQGFLRILRAAGAAGLNHTVLPGN